MPRTSRNTVGGGRGLLRVTNDLKDAIRSVVVTIHLFRYRHLFEEKQQFFVAHFDRVVGRKGTRLMADGLAI